MSSADGVLPADARRAATIPAWGRENVVRLVMYAILPVIVFVAYLNLSDILIRNLGIPSILQPMMLLMAVPILWYHAAFRPESVIMQPVTLGVVAYCLFVFASSNWAHDVSAADATLFLKVKDVLIMMVVAAAAASWRALRVGLIALTTAATLLSVLTLIQVAIDRPDVTFGGLVTVDVGHLFGETRDARPAGPVGDANYFARVLLVALPIAAFLGIGARARIARFTYGAAAVLITFAVLFTYSRGGILTLAAVAGLLVLAGRVRVTPVNALVAVLLIIALIPTNVGKRALTMVPLVEGGAIDDSAEKRWLLLDAGYRIWADHPIVGVGAGNFGKRYPNYANLIGWSGTDYIPAGVRQYPHNLYVEVAVETGLVGLFIFLGLIAAALLALYRSRRILIGRGDLANAALVTGIAIAIAGYLVASIFLHSGYERYLWLILAFAIAAIRLTTEHRFAVNR
jgi:putative inorganic carbon (hco3(-)) transporter